MHWGYNKGHLDFIEKIKVFRNYFKQNILFWEAMDYCLIPDMTFITRSLSENKNLSFLPYRIQYSNLLLDRVYCGFNLKIFVLEQAISIGYASNRGIIILNGPGISQNSRLDNINLTDVVPTLSYILGIEPPKQSEGRVIREAFN